MPEILGDRGIYFDPFNTIDILSKLEYILQMSEENKIEYSNYCYERSKVFQGTNSVKDFLQWIDSKREKP